MAGIIKARIDVQKLPKEKFYKGKKGVYYEFILSINPIPLPKYFVKVVFPAPKSPSRHKINPGKTSLLTFIAKSFISLMSFIIISLFIFSPLISNLYMKIIT